MPAKSYNYRSYYNVFFPSTRIYNSDSSWWCICSKVRIICSLVRTWDSNYRGSNKSFQKDKQPIGFETVTKVSTDKTQIQSIKKPNKQSSKKTRFKFFFWKSNCRSRIKPPVKIWFVRVAWGPGVSKKLSDFHPKNKSRK